MTSNPNPGGVTAPFQVDIEKLYQGEYWTNRYFLNSGSLADAVTAANAIAAMERAVHFNTVTLTKYSVRTTTKLDYIYKTVPLNQLGQAAPTTNMLPLFVCTRVDLEATEGRPSRKYLRGVLQELHLNVFDLDAQYRTFINENYALPLAALAALVDIDGQDIVSGAVNPKVAMRQLRRGSKKKASNNQLGD